MTYAITIPPAKGALTAFDAATGAFTYLPGADQSGSDQFTVTVSDGVLTSAPAIVTIAITGPGSTGRPWIFSRPPFEALPGDLRQWTVQVDVSDLTAPSLSFTLIGAPAGMTLVADAASATAAVSWAVPADQAAGYLRFAVVVIDATSRTAAVQRVALLIHDQPGGSQ